jgi:hypothetical protein
MWRRRRVLILSVLVLVIGIGGVLIVGFRDRARPVSADELSAVGDVYVYETTGFETTSALSGTEHQYPADTFATVSEGSCGLVTRWEALRERWTEWDRCDGGLRVATRQVYHEFFRTADLAVFVCEIVAGTPSAEQGATWTSRCDDGSNVETSRHLTHGVEKLQIGGVTVDAVHLEQVTETAGVTNGSSKYEEWLRVGDGLLLRQIATFDTVTDTRIGDVAHHEEYEIVLRSLNPAVVD